WAAGLGAYSVAAGALAWGAAAGWSHAAFRVYYLGGALLTAALLGVGSLLLVRKRWITPVALVYVGVAIGVAVAVPLHGNVSGTEIPEAQDVLDFWPARIVAIVGNSLGTLAVVGVALAGLGIGALAPAIAIAAVLLYLGFVAPASFAKPRPHENADHHERDG